MLFINAVAEVTCERAQSFLEDGHIEKIVVPTPVRGSARLRSRGNVG